MAVAAGEGDSSTGTTVPLPWRCATHSGLRVEITNQTASSRVTDWEKSSQ